MKKIYKIEILTALFALVFTASFADTLSNPSLKGLEEPIHHQQIRNEKPGENAALDHSLKSGESVPTAPLMKESGENENGLSVHQEIARIDGSPLTEQDFRIGGLLLGEDFVHSSEDLKDFSRTKGNLADVYRKEGLAVYVGNPFLLSYMYRKDLDMNQVFPRAGIVRIVLDKAGRKTARGIAVGEKRENLLRAYGKADEILWDEKANLYHFIYRMGEKELRFMVSKEKISSIEASFGTASPALRSKPYTEVDPKLLPDRDFKMAGYELHAFFEPRSAVGWDRKMTGESEEILYYPGFSVRTDKKTKYIQALFVTDNRMLTSRGITLGDDVSTVDLLYGPPHKLEVNTGGGFPRTAYIYFAQGKKNVLIIYIKNKKVDGILSAGNPQKEN